MLVKCRQTQFLAMEQKCQVNCEWLVDTCFSSARPLAENPWKVSNANNGCRALSVASGQATSEIV